MTVVFVQVDGKTVRAEVSDETYRLLRDGSFLRGRTVSWFLYLVVKEYGSLNEENIRKSMEENWVI